MFIKELTREQLVSIIGEHHWCAKRMPTEGSKIFGLFHGPYTMVGAVFYNFEWNVNGVDHYTLSTPLIPGYVSDDQMTQLIKESASNINGVIKMWSDNPPNRVAKWVLSSGFTEVFVDENSGEHLYMLKVS